MKVWSHTRGRRRRIGSCAERKRPIRAESYTRVKQFTRSTERKLDACVHKDTSVRLYPADDQQGIDEDSYSLTCNYCRMSLAWQGEPR